MTTLFLARHGETEWNTQKRLQGHLDSPLTDVGIQQARILATCMSDKNISHIVHSPLYRAKHTADIITNTLAITSEEHPQLIERHFGDWQQALFSDLTNEKNFDSIFFDCNDLAPPNGESGFDCGNRLKAALMDIAERHSGKSIMVISHGDVIRCFMASLGINAKLDAYSQYGNGRFFSLGFDEQSKILTLIDNDL